MFSPFDKHLSEIAKADLERLISDEVPEGLFVEYKGEWESRKIARAVASFANSPGGGWLIVGMRAEGLTPREIVGVEGDDELEARVVNTVRNSIDPVPSFSPRAVTVDDVGNKACLLVHVPEGTQPPYILVRTGQVLVRTPTSSEPIGVNDREAVDRLFARGERGRTWATNRADELSLLVRDNWSAVVWTVPAVDQGLAFVPGIFRESVIQAVTDAMKRFHWVSSAFLNHRVQPGMGEDLVSVLIPTYENEDSRLNVHVRGSGIIRAEWNRPRKGTDAESLKTLFAWALPATAWLYENHLDHRGDVAVAGTAHWMVNEEPQTVSVTRAPVPLSEFTDSTFHESLGRAINRAQGSYVIEPEPP